MGSFSNGPIIRYVPFNDDVVNNIECYLEQTGVTYSLWINQTRMEKPLISGYQYIRLMYQNNEWWVSDKTSAWTNQCSSGLSYQSNVTVTNNPIYINNTSDIYFPIFMILFIIIYTIKTLVNGFIRKKVL